MDNILNGIMNGMTGGVLNWLLLIGFIILVANIILSGLIVFFERRNPSSTWAWLLVLLFVPVLGFVVYMVFGRNSRREKMFLQKEDYDRSVYHNDAEAVRRNREQKKILRNNERLLENEYVTDLIHMHLNSGSWLTFNNRIDYYNNGRDKFDALIEDIRSAKKHIHLEYYIWRGDKLGKILADELMKKAKEGVEVRVLYDGIGNSRLPKHFFEELEAAGGYTAAFLPRFVVRLNYRNHRKLAIIDGEIGYIGGFNVGDEYLGIKKRYGSWRDTHLRFRGGAVEQMQLRFLKDWNFTSPKGKMTISDWYFPDREDFDGVPTQIVSSGPDTKWNNVRNGFFKMMNEAESHIYLTTPYFVPDDSIFEALRVAALAGIDVRIIIPGNPDHFFVYWASMSYLGELLEAGVKVYQYEKGFIHAKVLTIDGNVATVGSANMDVRSFVLNFEVNAFMYDKETTEMLENEFRNDLRYCVEITKEWYHRRRWWFKVKEAVARLVSPLL